jgi:hypothetical protein
MSSPQTLGAFILFCSDGTTLLAVANDGSYLNFLHLDEYQSEIELPVRVLIALMG